VQRFESEKQGEIGANIYFNQQSESYTVKGRTVKRAGDHYQRDTKCKLRLFKR